VIEEALFEEEENRALAVADASAQREMLAHASRVSTMEGLAASLSHDLNQPLAAILSNAQAARRFMRAENPDLEEISTILSDIIAADKRAGELIWKLRSFVRREPAQHRPLNLNDTIRGVVDILNSDMVIRGVELRPELKADLPLVLGDEIQLQQVVVNLVTNAEQAMADLPQPKRCIDVRTREEYDRMVVVEIRDRGPGVDLTKSNIFEPFYTTKPDGMGMGLAICRSLIESHGGRIWAENAEEGGARMCFALPVQDTTMANNESENGHPPRV
jgi:two-component system sensor kinase FixL